MVNMAELIITINAITTQSLTRLGQGGRDGRENGSWVSLHDEGRGRMRCR
jgi:hypothetical protein